MSAEILTLKTLGDLSAIFMVAGYLVYGLCLWLGLIRANGTAWGLMCISASTLLVVEFLHGVPWNGLKAGFADSVIAFFVFAIAYFLGRLVQWSEKDKKLVLWYFLLLGLYIAGDFFGNRIAENMQLAIYIGVSVIILYNLTTTLEFVPIIREAWYHNEDELPWAWIIWTLSYGIYFYVRLLEGVDLVNLVYPAISVVLHGLVAIITIPAVFQRSRVKLINVARPDD